MDGGELTERARDVVPGLRVLLMAARGEEGVAELLPAYRYLPCRTKPVFRDQLAAVLQRVIGPPAMEPSTRASMGRPRSWRPPSGSHRS
jgi:hypothetical protein